jgi:hypothetical protein
MARTLKLSGYRTQRHALAPQSLGLDYDGLLGGVLDQPAVYEAVAVGRATPDKFALALLVAHSSGRALCNQGALDSDAAQTMVISTYAAEEMAEIQSEAERQYQGESGREHDE